MDFTARLGLGLDLEKLKDDITRVRIPQVYPLALAQVRRRRPCLNAWCRLCPIGFMCAYRVGSFGSRAA
jgi:hypothetical protein